MTATKARGLAMTVASQRQRQILDAARACIAEQGIEKVTMRRVAERAGVCHGTITYYFKSKKRLTDAALLEMAKAYVNDLYSDEGSPYGPDGPDALNRLLEAFLDRNNRGASFVVQMIDAGLHDLELRTVHHELVQYGEDLIERFIRAGIEAGEYRPDLKSGLAAKLIHSVLVWWGSELGGAATSRELASSAGRLALDLLRPYDGAAPQSGSEGAKRLPSKPASALEMVRSAILSDPSIERGPAEILISAFERMYMLAARKVRSGSGDQGRSGQEPDQARQDHDVVKADHRRAKDPPQGRS